MTGYDGPYFGELEPELGPEPGPPTRPRRWPHVVTILTALLCGTLAGWIARPAIIPPEVDQATPHPTPTVTVTPEPQTADTSGDAEPPAACLEALDITNRLIDLLGRYETALIEGASDDELDLMIEEAENFGLMWGMTEPVCREPIN